MNEARQAASRLAPEDIVEAAEDLLCSVPESGAPGFILERLSRLRLMICMLSDIEWRLPHQEATRVLNALAYFTEPDDLIPDHIPGLGFLDDAIMVELVVRELEHEIEAYRDFCESREQNSSSSREAWLAERRESLQARMRERRESGDRGTSLGLFD